jgi:DNA polymerase-1
MLPVRKVELSCNDNEIVRDILEWRQMVKLQSTYIDALPNQVDKKRTSSYGLCKQ